MSHLVAPTISTQFRRAAFVVLAATALMLVAMLARKASPAGTLTPRQLGEAVDWNGWIAGVSDGTYTFTVPPGGGAQLAIDGRVVADGKTSTAVHLEASPHAFDFQDRRGASRPTLLRPTTDRPPDTTTGSAPRPTTERVSMPTADSPEIFWSRDGAPPTPLPRSVLFARKPRALTMTAVRVLDGFAAASQWIWILAIVGGSCAVALAAWRVLRQSIASQVDWPRLRWIVLGSLVLNATPIWWGLPAIWPPDELTPGTVLRALGTHFSNGWFDRWPPFHYYVLTVAMSPVLLLNALGRINFDSGAWPQVLTLMERSVSLAAGAATLIAAALVASHVFGRRAGLLAAAIFALAIPFPYYARTANLDVPYLFWFAVSLVFYLRVLETVQVRDAVAFAASATLAVCTKDQAYALYPLVMVAIGFRAWETRRLAPVLAGVATAVVIFALCHNLVFNWAGFVEHVRYIAGPGSENYRAFTPTLAGRLGLLRLTASLIKDSWGWPVTLVCVAGAVHALFVRRCLPAWMLLAPAISYYFAFINVVLYNYDRFVLPMTLILAMFGGYAMDGFLSAVPSRVLRRSALGAVFAYSLLYAATIDALMLRDSRDVVERWAADRLKAGEQIAISGPRELEPSFTVPWVDIATLADLDRVRPAYYVLSADYARAVPLETGWGELINGLQSGTAGYGLIARVRCPLPWWWLPGLHAELVGPRPIAPGGNAVSVLRDVNPTLEVYARGARPREDMACTATLLP